MRKLNIEITKAQLLSFSVDFDFKDNKLDVGTTLALLTSGGKKITSYTISTSAWQDETKFVLPIECIPHIKHIAKALEEVAVKHCRDSQLALSAPKKND